MFLLNYLYRNKKGNKERSSMSNKELNAPDIRQAIEKADEIIHAIEQSEAALNKGIYTLEYYKYRNICNEVEANKLINEYEGMMHGQEFIKKDAKANKNAFEVYLDVVEKGEDIQNTELEQIQTLIYDVDKVHDKIGELMQESDVTDNCEQILIEDDY